MVSHHLIKRIVVLFQLIGRVVLVSFRISAAPVKSAGVIVKGRHSVKPLAGQIAVGHHEHREAIELRVGHQTVVPLSTGVDTHGLVLIILFIPTAVFVHLQSVEQAAGVKGLIEKCETLVVHQALGARVGRFKQGVNLMHHAVLDGVVTVEVVDVGDGIQLQRRGHY